MKERPILFSGEMVRAILAGTKTQTRRIVKPQPPCGCRYVINGANSHALCQSIDQPEIWVLPTARSKDHRFPCPYGRSGDRLWVRETFARNEVMPLSDREPGDFIYRADLGANGVSKWSASWKPSIFCPRVASRITLEITAVRLERLNDICAADALAEGVGQTKFWKPKEVDENPKPIHEWAEKYWDDFYFWTHYPQRAYRALWDSINGGGSWTINPWVWVITFRRIS